VHLAEAREQLGGRVAHETLLPGLGAWGRVRDYRLNQLKKLQNVEILRGSRVTADQVLEFGATRIVLATGSTWRRDGVGRANTRPIPGFSLSNRVVTPDDIMEGLSPEGPVVVFDDDHYYLGAILAERLRNTRLDVTLVTPAACVSAWTVNTLEQHAIQKRVMEMGIGVVTGQNIIEFDGSRAVLQCMYTERVSTMQAASILTVTSRLPNSDLALALDGLDGAMKDAGIVSVRSIGDCFAPSTIAAAVYAGHRHAREFDRPASDDAGFRRELPSSSPP
jgi:dimethylamine/trimethylamine dehydrogenase